MMVSNAEPPDSKFQVLSSSLLPSCSCSFSAGGSVPFIGSCSCLQPSGWAPAVLLLRDFAERLYPTEAPVSEQGSKLANSVQIVPSSPQLDGALLEAPSSSSTRAFTVFAFGLRSRTSSTQSTILSAQPADCRYGRTGDGAECKETWQRPATRRQSRQAALWGPLLTGLVVWA